jgi:hypothetical protein
MYQKRTCLQGYSWAKPLSNFSSDALFVAAAEPARLLLHGNISPISARAEA